jgi:4'-phosphopantetheinyl transferase EntD
VDNSHHIVQLAPWVESLFPKGVIATQVYGAVSPSHLLPEETMCIETAVLKRQREFAAGRVCARLALATMGFVKEPLLATQERMPRWPKGAVGSISHTDAYCVAVAGLEQHFSGIGVDTEIVGRVEPDLWPQVFRFEEMERLKPLSQSRQIEIATVMFSAKEAFYKCQFALTRAWLGFEDVSVETAGDRFRVVVCNRNINAALAQESLHGHFAIDGTRVVCGMAIST